MKFHQMLLGAAIFLTACSAPKYVYHFDHYDYNSGKKSEEPIQEIRVEKSPLAVNPETVVASANDQTLVVADDEKEKSTATAKAFADKYKAMTKTERKELRKELKKEIKSFAKKEVRKENSVMSVKATQAFDALVSAAMIFGGAGIVLIMLANISNVFWILGVISLVIGAGLFVKWVTDGNG